MADVFIAAAAEANAPARGLADVLAVLGFKAEAKQPAEAELTKAILDAKCVVALWPSSDAPTPPWLAAAAALALEHKTLVCLEFGRDATPALFRAAPRIDLHERDRTAFKAKFETLVTEIAKLAPREAEPSAEKAAEALVKARLALTPARRGRRWTLGGVALVAALVFAVGFGAGRVLNAARSGTLLVASSSANAASTTAIEGPEQPRFGVTLDELETLPWRDAAAKIDEGMADRIKAEANRGDALAQSLACLGHMAGADGFLPSPAAARQACDAAAGQGYPAGLYLSWALYRAAPRGVIDEATARARLHAAAEQGWLAAQLDYAQLLAGDFRAPIADQTAAGRLWLATAERGDPRGQYQYARWLRDSPAGPRDPSAATPFLERAAERGQPEALHMLATLLRDGIGVPRDATRARALYERAAGRNHPPSMYNLAAMIETGTSSDRTRATALYRALACMPDERQIQPMAVQRLRAMGEAPAACG